MVFVLGQQKKNSSYKCHNKIISEIIPLICYIVSTITLYIASKLKSLNYMGMKY